MMSLTVEELVAILGAKQARIPYEIGAFVALEVCETVREAPAIADPQSVMVASDGTVSVASPPDTASRAEAASSVKQLLGHLLTLAGPAIPPLIVALSTQERARNGDALASMASELRGALMPLNRGAARRVLARLIREAQSLDQGEAEALVPEDHDTLPGVDSTPGDTGQVGPATAVRGGSETRAVAWRFLGAGAGAVAVLALLGLGVLLWLRAGRAENVRLGDLSVRVAPPAAQVLLFVGRGPAVAEGLPVGVAHEFVAIAEGRAPGRSLVPAGAHWERTRYGRSYKLTLNLGAGAGAGVGADLDVDIATPLAPVVRASRRGGLGEVHIVTAPSGARVYRLAGVGPTVRLRALRTDLATELLVASAGYLASRVIAGPSDWRYHDGRATAELRVTLEPAQAR